MSEEADSCGAESEEGVVPEVAKHGLPRLPETDAESDSNDLDLNYEESDVQAKHGK